MLKINLNTDTPKKLAEDFEVQNWVAEMVRPQSDKPDGGCCMLGIPKKLTTVEQLVDIVTAVISICSMGHAAANFQQYEAYSFMPNYPVILMKMPPQTKVQFSSLILMFYYCFISKLIRRLGCLD
jgi:Lipoxygenase